MQRFTVEKILFSSDKTRVLRVWDGERQSHVIVKALQLDSPSPADLARFRREYAIHAKLSSLAEVISVYSCIPWEKSLAIVMEDIEGNDLSTQGLQVSVDEFLNMAKQWVSGLQGIHQRHCIHKDINPRNVLYNRDTKTLRVIDFGITTELAHEQQESDIDKLEGSLPYMSPEQTGRINRYLDYRSDYYSLGVSFYEILAGQLPYAAKSALEWIHSHVACDPLPLREVRADLPEGLYQIIDKLMAKDPEQRYQSSYGLLVDLGKVTALYQTAQNTPIDLGQADISERFDIPQKLYGRDEELRLLLDAFQEASQGHCRLVSVGGVSGVGKTVLVREVEKSLTAVSGEFVAGKFDQFKRNVPYLALSTALGQIIKAFSAHGPAKRQELCEELHSKIGENLGLLTKLIPGLQTLLGATKELKDLTPSEAEARFLMAFRELIAVFAKPEHPLVVFLDDVQWADSATLRILFDLLAYDMGAILLIVAYRDNEVDEAHPLAAFFMELDKGQQRQRINIKSLSQHHVRELTEDTLKHRSDLVGRLSERFYQKTRGNPFFLTQMIKNLHSKGHIYYDHAAGVWSADEEKIAEEQVSEHVADFMLGLLQELPKATQEALNVAAFLGNRVLLKTLVTVSSRSPKTIALALLPAIEKEIIIPTAGYYGWVTSQEEEQEEEELDFDVAMRFQHDRLQQAAYQLLAEDQRDEQHLRMARLLDHNDDASEHPTGLIELVRHYNQGRSKIVDRDEKLHVARLNLLAGKNARQATAYPSADLYLKVSCELLDESIWQRDYELAKTIYQESASCAYLNTRFDEAEAQGLYLLSQVRSDLEKAKIYLMQTQQLAVLGKLDAAIDKGLQGLKALNIHLAEKPSSLVVASTLLGIKWRLRGVVVSELEHLPVLQGERWRLATDILIALCAPAFLIQNNNLFAMLGLRLLKITLKEGVSPSSATAFSIYGILLSAMRDMRDVYAFGELAVKINERFNDLEYRSRTFFVFGVFLQGWNRHWNELQATIKKAVDAGYRSGDLFYMSQSCADVYLWNQSFDLKASSEGQLPYLALIRKNGYQNAHDMGMIFQSFRYALLGQTRAPLSLDHDDFIEAQAAQRFTDSNYVSGHALIHLYRLQLGVWHQDSEYAYKEAKITGRFIQSLMGIYWVAEFSLFAICAYCTHYPKMQASEKLKAKMLIALHLHRIKGWANHNPVNFGHMYALALAENAKRRRRWTEAQEQYEHAAGLAERNGYLFYEALIMDRLRALVASRGKVKLELFYAKHTIQLLERLAIYSRSAVLKAQYAQFNSPPERSRSLTSSLHESVSMRHQLIDGESLMKASLAIAGEVHTNKLIKTVLATISENLAANRALLVLKDPKSTGQMLHDVKLEAPEVFQRQAHEALLPYDFIVRCLQTAQVEVLEASSLSKAYFKASPVQSAMALPIERQGKVIGVLYCENHKVRHAFTTDRVKLVQAIVSQAAVSIENSYLYQNLEEEVRKRTRQLEDAQARVTEMAKWGAIGEMANGIAHEINNPLSIIEGMSAHLDHLVQQPQVESTKVSQKVKTIQRMVFRIADIVQQLRQFAHDTPEHKYEPLNLNQALEGVLGEFRKKATPIDLSVSLFAGTVVVNAAQGRLEQAVSMVLDNAYDACALLDDARIVVSCHFDGSTAEILISDNGPGVPEDIADKIFQPFFTGKSLGKGRGLGLTTAKNAVEAMRGQISFTSRQRQTVFAIKLPAQLASQLAGVA